MHTAVPRDPGLPARLPMHKLLEDFKPSNELYRRPLSSTPVIIDARYQCRLDALILMSTPAGKLNLFSASIVFAVACTMSIRRL